MVKEKKKNSIKNKKWGLPKERIFFYQWDKIRSNNYKRMWKKEICDACYSRGVGGLVFQDTTKTNKENKKRRGKKTASTNKQTDKKKKKNP